MAIQVVEQSELSGEFEGYLFGSEVTVILHRSENDGAGPRLHRHPYTETFILRTGSALFTVGDEQIVASGGQILVVPSLVPHKFSGIGTALFESVHIHANDRFVTEWLE